MLHDRALFAVVTKNFYFSLLVGLFVVAGWATPSLATAETPLGDPPVWPAPIQGAVTFDEDDPARELAPQWRASDPPPWVDIQNRGVVRTLFLVDYQSSVGVDSEWTGNHASCGAGATSEAFRAAILRRINYFRSMAGIPPLTGFNSSYSQKAQAAALMMSVNRKLSHQPDSSWACYTAEGRQGAGSSNLYLGVYGPEAISGYIEDPGSGNYFAGHRRWILYPQTRYMGTGDIPRQDGYSPANALWVFDADYMWGPRPETREDFVAWPPPGYVPYQVVYPRWSFAYPEADFSQATVTMTQNGQVLVLQSSLPVNGYGENTLIWEPQASFNTPPAADTIYQVTVSNIVIEGQARSFTYPVTIFDPQAQSFFISTPVTDAVQDASYAYAVAVEPVGAGGALTITVSTLPAWLTLVDHGDGTATLTGMPTNADVGDYAITLYMADNRGVVDTQSFTLTIANVNDAPVFTSAPLTATIPGLLYTYVITGTDPDLMWGDTLTITATTLPGWLTLVDHGNGTATLAGTLTKADVSHYPVVLRVADRVGLTDTQTFTTTVWRQFYAPLMLNNMP